MQEQTALRRLMLLPKPGVQQRRKRFLSAIRAYGTWAALNPMRRASI
jgi:hypothetical protein